MSKESKALKEIDEKLKTLKWAFENFMPIYHQVDRKRRSLDLEIKVLEDEKQKLQQGQMLFNAEF
jgi:hypothetical protein